MLDGVEPSVYPTGCCWRKAMAPRFMLQIMQMMFALIRSLFAGKADLALEVLALRQQLAVFKRKQPRPRLTDLDRAFWTALKDQFAAWADALVIVRPETVVRWQKKRFRKHWTRKSKPGRPSIPRQHIAFIKRISGDHPEYGEDRIALELEVKFGIKHSTAAVRKYMVKPSRPRKDSTSWRIFLKNQADAIWTRDFCVQQTIRFTALYIFVIMELGSRRVVHVNATEHPSLAWVKQQVRDATFEGEPKFLIHDPSTPLRFAQARQRRHLRPVRQAGRGRLQRQEDLVSLFSRPLAGRLNWRSAEQKPLLLPARSLSGLSKSPSTCSPDAPFTLQLPHRRRRFDLFQPPRPPHSSPG